MPRFLTNFLAALALLAAAPLLQAARPLCIDDAGTLEQHHWQLEIGNDYLKDSATHHLDWPLTLTYGLLPNLQVSLDFGGQYETGRDPDDAHRSTGGCRDLTLAAKWKFLDQAQAPLSLAVTPAVKLPTAPIDDDLGTGRCDFGCLLIATRDFGPCALDLNLGYLACSNRAEERIPDVIHYGVALRYPVNPKLTLVGEVVADTPTSRDPTVATTLLGLQYELAPHWICDFGVGTGLTHQSPDLIVRLGLTVVF